MMDMTWINALLVGAGCFALGYLMSARHLARNFVSTRVAKETSVVDVNKKNRSKEPLEIEKLADILEDFKMVLVVRNDLKMGKGKIAAQCSHATLGLYKKLLHRAPKALNRWEMCGQVKVVVKIESEEDLLVLQEKAKSLNIPTHVTIDAGRTQIAPSESPSSSASDVDNLNNQAMVDKAALSKSIGAHAGNHAIVAHNHPNFVRLLNFTKDVNSAMDASKKSQDAFAAEAISRRLITHHGYKLTVQLFSV